MQTKEKKLNAWFQAIHWNQSNPIGTPIVFDSQWLGPHLCFTRSPATVLIDAPCVWVTSHLGAVILDRLKLASEAGIRSVQVVSECVNGPLLVPLTTHSPTHPGSMSMSEAIRIQPAELPSGLTQNCRADLTQTKGETVAEPTLHPSLQYFESYRKEWIFGQICIRVSVMNYVDGKRSKGKGSLSGYPAEVVRAITSKAASAKHAKHRQKIEATGISFAEHQRKLNRLRVQKWRERHPELKNPVLSEERKERMRLRMRRVREKQREARSKAA